jgi:hypothetical protein
MTTLAAGSDSADDCATPPGHGSGADPSTGVYDARPCPAGTYGRAN